MGSRRSNGLAPELASLGRTGSGGTSALAARFQTQDMEQVDALWRRVRIEVLDPLEAALVHFDPKATEVVRSKYYDVYSSVYHIVNDPGRDDLDRHPLIIAKHLETLTDYLHRITLPALSETHEAYLLRAVGEQWDKFLVLNNWMHKLLIFVERSYVSRQPHKMGLKERGIRKFSEVVFSKSGRLGPLVTAIDTILTRRRAGEEIEYEDREACRTCIQLLVETGVTVELKEQLLASAREFFAGRAADWIVEGGVSGYMSRVEAALAAEEGLIEDFDLGKATGEETLVVGVQELVVAHGESLLLREVGGCAWLLNQRKHEELGLMYRLFRREAGCGSAGGVGVGGAAGGQMGRNGSPQPPTMPSAGSSASTTELASLSALSLTSNIAAATTATAGTANGGTTTTTPRTPTAMAVVSSTPPTNTNTQTTTTTTTTSDHPLLDRMGTLLESHIISLGDELQRDRNARLAKDRKLEAYDPTYIDALLQIHADYIELTTLTLGAHSVFKSRLHAAFVAILNHRGRSLEEKPRLITTACDRLLRVGGTSEEAKVNDILSLVVYLKDKDYFESCYRTEMMRRLLSNRYGEGAEKSALAKLRLEHGVHFAQHSQRMLNETATSKELVQSFLATPEAERLRSLRLDFSVTVMAQGGWPLPATYAQFACRPPAPLALHLEAFTSYYLGLDIGRGKKLEWVLREGLLVVQATYPRTGARYEISSNPQMLFPLLAFAMDESVELSLAALVERTGMNPANLQIVLAELQKAGLLLVQKQQQQLLVPRDESSELQQTSSASFFASASSFASTSSTASSTSSLHQTLVTLNPNFTSKHKRITILPKKMDEDKEKAMSEDIVKERTLKCQAIIVRIMKLKKTLAYRDLVVETIRQCKHFNFTPEVNFVRRVVEGLIDTEYLRRTPERRDWLDYMA